jgi:hypothetical protein
VVDPGKSTSSIDLDIGHRILSGPNAVRSEKCKVTRGGAVPGALVLFQAMRERRARFGGGIKAKSCEHPWPAVLHFAPCTFHFALNLDPPWTIWFDHENVTQIIGADPNTPI